MIRKATLSDLNTVKTLTGSCAQVMQKNGIFQWNDHYPSRAILGKDIDREELFVLEEKGRILGIIALTPVMDEEYIPVKWLTPNGKNLYVHRLATHPSVWGAGYGQKLMEFAEKTALEEGYLSVRLDTFSRNKRNQKFYESRGYIRLENVFFPEQSDDPFFCYEKILE
ncbi:GNAT family N-acetyltransferase [Salinimicrobium flavum]|uniref:GNAT family N-acetyltransferase n=1 Tax=Salinimicrobium flavum TaxID=1737065 RepID=A0ABW5IWW3_9FLAO